MNISLLFWSRGLRGLGLRLGLALGLRSDGLGLGLLRLQHPDDDALFFNEEGPDDSLTEAFVTENAAVSAEYLLLRLGKARQLTGAGGGDAAQLPLAVAAFRDVARLLLVEVDELASGRADDLTTVARRVVRQPATKSEPLNHLSTSLLTIASNRTLVNPYDRNRRNHRQCSSPPQASNGASAQLHGVWRHGLRTVNTK